MLAFLFAFFYIDADGHGPGGDQFRRSRSSRRRCPHFPFEGR